MPPWHQTLPPAQTASAKEAMQAFYCNLCSKGYSRVNDYEAHLSSYDHSHKQRLKDMKAMVRDPNAGARARKAEAKADGMVTLKVAANDAAAPKKGGFKKSGFKSAFAPAEAPPAPIRSTGDTPTRVAPQPAPLTEHHGPRQSPDRFAESDTEDEGYEMYDPRHPTD